MLLITKLIRSNRHLNVLFQCTVLALCRFEGRARMIFCRMEKNGTEPKERKIPKIIHLCWFGEQPYPTIVLRCLHSWYRRLPDYKIMLWNDASHLYGEFPFIEEALKSKKYAFAADVVRVYAVYKYGGIYMDSDIFVRKRFDNYLNHRTVLFREYYPEYVFKCYTCHSWILGSNVAKTAKEGSNLSEFRKRFDVIYEEPCDDILKYVFRWNTNRENFRKENAVSSFSQAVYRQAMKNETFYIGYGVIAHALTDG